MNISQEILVLDFGDEKNEFLKSEADFGGGELLIAIELSFFIWCSMLIIEYFQTKPSR